MDSRPLRMRMGSRNCLIGFLLIIRVSGIIDMMVFVISASCQVNSRYFSSADSYAMVLVTVAVSSSGSPAQ